MRTLLFYPSWVGAMDAWFTDSFRQRDVLSQPQRDSYAAH